MEEIVDWWVENDPKLVDLLLGGAEALRKAKRARFREKGRLYRQAERAYMSAKNRAEANHPEIGDIFHRQVNAGLSAAYWGLGMIYQNRKDFKRAQNYLGMSKDYYPNASREYR